LPEIDRIPAAVFLGVVPGKQEVSHAARLPAIGLRYSEQTSHCRERGDRIGLEVISV
jgi:hypothetical protein